MHIRSLLFFSAALLLGACSKEAQKNHDNQPAASAHAETKEPFGRFSIDEVEAKLAEAKAGKLALAIIDNNGQARFKQSHLPTAKWLDHNNLKAEDLPADKDTTLVFYCSSEL